MQPQFSKILIFFTLLPVLLAQEGFQNFVQDEPFMENDIIQEKVFATNDAAVETSNMAMNEVVDEDVQEILEDQNTPRDNHFMADDVTDDDCSIFPNQTYYTPYFYSCHNDEAPPKLVVHDSAVANSTGDYQYPLDFTQQVRFFFDVTSFANRRYDNIRAEVYLYKRRTGWLGCGWLFLPTFGIIDNYDVCEDNLSCPVYPGRQVIEVSIKPKVVFSGIFKMIHNKKVPYQLLIRLVNNRRPSDELMCVVYQAKINF